MISKIMGTLKVQCFLMCWDIMAVEFEGWDKISRGVRSGNHRNGRFPDVSRISQGTGPEPFAHPSRIGLYDW